MRTRVTQLLVVVGAGACALGRGAAAAEQNIADLSIEELSDMHVTTVSRQPERLADAAASVYVITSDDIRRSGVTTLPEALRLAPNLQVARVDSVQYAISARGFNNAIGNKLLVMIDGRTVYTPLFSGVFWDQQDVLLADVDRIEVISGPGATLWGANAVNGVINIITRPASETQGTYFSVGAGDAEQQAAVRYGGKLGDYGFFRAYAKTSAFANTETASGAAALDEWGRSQAGFRGDWHHDSDTFTLSADTYSGESEDRGTVVGIPFGSIEVSGYNVLGRWTRDLTTGGKLEVQTYFDHTERDDLLFFRPYDDIFDVEVTHSIPLGKQDLLWGGGYRTSSDTIDTGYAASFIPKSASLDWENLFIQDAIHLNAHVDTTIGVKLEDNDYTGTEYLPSVRVGWKLAEHRLLWSALSRAVRAPSRFDKDVYFPGNPPFLVVGGPNFVSEVANVLEVGYRAEASDRVTYSVTLFRHDWNKLRSGTSLPVQLENKIEGPVQGVEAWATWRVTPSWQLSGGFNTIDKNLHLEPGSTDPVGVNNETLANDADYQWVMRSTTTLRHNVELDIRARHVEALPNPAVPAYTAVDATVLWPIRKRLSVAVSVWNLFDPSHPEYGPAASRSELPRAIYVELRHAGL